MSLPPGGFEPPAYGLGNRCSILLSYGGIFVWDAWSARVVTPDSLSLSADLPDRKTKAKRQESVAVGQTIPSGVRRNAKKEPARKSGSTAFRVGQRPLAHQHGDSRFDPSEPAWAGAACRR